MGLTAERVARRYQISREGQDTFALESHRRALAAQTYGRFTDELVPVKVITATPGSGRSRKAASRGKDIRRGRGPARGPFRRSTGQAQARVRRPGNSPHQQFAQTSDGPAATVGIGSGPRCRTRAEAHRRPPRATPPPAACPKRWAWGRSMLCQRRSNSPGSSSVTST